MHLDRQRATIGPVGHTHQAPLLTVISALIATGRHLAPGKAAAPCSLMEKAVEVGVELCEV